MTRKPSIPMTPTALPKQRSPEETVLPCRPEGTSDWGREQLEALVTRDTMIGVTLPRVPAEG